MFSLVFCLDLVFLQGYPFDHLHNINENNLNNSIKKLIKEKKHVIFLNKPFTEKVRTPPVKVKRSYYFNEYYMLLFKSTLPGIHYTFSPGGQYIISKDTILSKPKIFSHPTPIMNNAIGTNVCQRRLIRRLGCFL